MIGVTMIDFDSAREGPELEGKRCSDRLSADFWPTYSAFANTFGGTIVLGVRDDGGLLRPEGIEDPEKILRDLWDQANNPQKVNVNLLSEDDVDVLDCDGLKLITVRVPRAERQRRPVYINGSMNSGTYRRHGEGDYHCSLAEIAEMVRDAHETPQDAGLCTKVLIGDLDDGSIEAFRNMMSKRTPSHPWNREPRDEFLRLIGAADLDDGGTLRPTVAGLLMFGRDYSITREVPRYMLDYREYGAWDDWDHRLTTDTGEWTGNLFDFFAYVTNRISLNSARAFPLDGAVRRDDTGMIEAARELVLNGIAHADYFGSGGVRIDWRPDRLTVRNPGTFRIPIGLARSGGHSDPRNPNVMRMFMLTGLAEREGLHRIVTVCRDMGLGMPEITESVEPSTVTASIGLRPGRRAPVGNDGILDALRRDPGITVAGLAEETGLSTSTVSRRIRELRDAGVLAREGSRRDGRWVVLEDQQPE